MKKAEILYSEPYLSLKDRFDALIKLSRKHQTERDIALKENKRLKAILLDVAYSDKPNAVKTARKYAEGLEK